MWILSQNIYVVSVSFPTSQDRYFAVVVLFYLFAIVFLFGWFFCWIWLRAFIRTDASLSTREILDRYVER